MDPNACIDRIRTALNGLDLDEVEYATEDLNAWLDSGGFAPSNFERIAKYTETTELVRRIARCWAVPSNAGLRALDCHRWAIANPSEYDRDGRLTLVTGPLRTWAVYVWGCTTVQDAHAIAKSWADLSDWPTRRMGEEQVRPQDRVVVLARSILQA